MARFAPAEDFYGADRNLQLLPFQFHRTEPDRYLVSNLVGDFIRLSDEEMLRVAELRLTPGDGLYEKAYAAHLITRKDQKSQLQLLAMRLRSRMSFLREPTP